jgi:hypothetical protein
MRVTDQVYLSVIGLRFRDARSRMVLTMSPGA